jgi:hypothetical protein
MLVHSGVRPRSHLLRSSRPEKLGGRERCWVAPFHRETNRSEHSTARTGSSTRTAGLYPQRRRVERFRRTLQLRSPTSSVPCAESLWLPTASPQAPARFQRPVPSPARRSRPTQRAGSARFVSMSTSTTPASPGWTQSCHRRRSSSGARATVTRTSCGSYAAGFARGRAPSGTSSASGQRTPRRAAETRATLAASSTTRSHRGRGTSESAAPSLTP